ncbi:hypothetical protein CsSME_00043285 [Camellia sinensis var. sinensis]
METVDKSHVDLEDAGGAGGAPVIAEIELEEKLQVLDRVRACAAESIRVDVKQCEICEESELLREVPGDVALVGIDTGNDVDRGVVRRRGRGSGGERAS